MLPIPDVQILPSDKQTEKLVRNFAEWGGQVMLETYGNFNKNTQEAKYLK